MRSMQYHKTGASETLFAIKLCLLSIVPLSEETQTDLFIFSLQKKIRLEVRPSSLALFTF